MALAVVTVWVVADVVVTVDVVAEVVVVTEVVVTVVVCAPAAALLERPSATRTPGEEVHLLAETPTIVKIFWFPAESWPVVTPM